MMPTMCYSVQDSSYGLRIVHLFLSTLIALVEILSYTGFGGNFASLILTYGLLQSLPFLFFNGFSTLPYLHLGETFTFRLALDGLIPTFIHLFWDRFSSSPLLHRRMNTSFPFLCPLSSLLDHKSSIPVFAVANLTWRAVTLREPVIWLSL